MQSVNSSTSTPQPSLLQKPATLSDSGMLSPSELAQLRQDDSEHHALLQEEFPGLNMT